MIYRAINLSMRRAPNISIFSNLSNASRTRLHTSCQSQNRAFSQTLVWNRKFSKLKVNEDRLLNDIHHSCQWGPGERWGNKSTEKGMSRLSLTDSDKEVRNWFAETTEALGCTVNVDEMGNQFAIRKGLRDGAPTCVGSHLDTQPTGGRYDGILGVTAGIEMLRVLSENNINTEFPIGVINWTNEEGARFPISMVSSAVWCGDVTLEKAHGLASVVRGDQNATMRSELQRIGYLGSIPCNPESMPVAAHFELHIEQGPILEKEKRKIGVVEGVQAYKWYTITVKGRECHTGTTDLESRSDALLVASKMIWASRVVATNKGGLASVGIIDAKPGSTNTVPGLVTFSLDLRAREDSVVSEMERELRQEFDQIATGSTNKYFHPATTPNGQPCTVEWRVDSNSPAVKFHKDCIQCVYDAAVDVFGDNTQSLTKRMMSGAGHDSVCTSRRVPTSMIFVPSRDGISHNPREWTAPEDCAIGARVLLGAVIHYDKLRLSRSSTLDT